MSKLLSHFVTVDPVNLSRKDRLLAVLGSFAAILMIGLSTLLINPGPAYPILVASMGASAVIIFITPHSPLAQPWPLMGGHLISALIGVACAEWIDNTALAAASAVSGCILAMLLLRCLHPPGAATAVYPALSHALTYNYVIFPVGINVSIMLVLAIIINRWLLGHHYPTLTPGSAKKSEPHTSLSNQDLQQAIENMGTYVDMSPDDLRKLVSDVGKQSFKRFKGLITVGDIMVKDVISVEYGTEVETAWKMMYSATLKAMPVVDRAQRVIGIITWSDFFKFLNLSPYQSFQENFRAFVRRTPDVSTNKPESVGHIMSTKVTVLPESAHIAELISLMSQQGYRQIPVVNSENRLVGMVYQANLIAALYNEQLAANA